jgi:hypothetical protein
MSQFYKIHLAFNRGCFEAIFMKNTLGCLGVKPITTCMPNIKVLAIVFICALFLVVIGLWLDPATPSGSGNFLRHIALFHSGILVFLLGDVFLLLGARMLTRMQAMHV